MDGDVFCAGAEQMPATTLRAGGIVICDNLSVHKNAMPCAAIEAPGEQAGRAALPACLFAGPRPHRDGIRQTHRPREKRRRPVRGYPLQSHGIRTRRLHLAGLRATPPPSRSCVNLIGVRAKAGCPWVEATGDSQALVLAASLFPSTRWRKGQWAERYRWTCESGRWRGLRRARAGGR